MKDRLKRFLVIGGMNMDILGTSHTPYTQGDSLPGEVNLGPGGVGRNIAHHLANAGHSVELLCPLGKDTLADLLKTACQQMNIGLRYAVQTSFSTSTYLAIHDQEGDMRCAVNDMRAMDALTSDVISDLLSKGIQADACVLDANLSASALKTAANMLSMPLIADPVSAVKCVRLLPILDRLAAIKPNRLEALALTGASSVEKAAEFLLQQGVQKVFISLGKEGVYFADARDKGLMPVPDISQASQTGAGDAMTASIAVSTSLGLGVLETAKRAVQASHHYLQNKQMTGN